GSASLSLAAPDHSPRLRVCAKTPWRRRLACTTGFSHRLSGGRSPSRSRGQSSAHVSRKLLPPEWSSAPGAGLGERPYPARDLGPSARAGARDGRASEHCRGFLYTATTSPMKNSRMNGIDLKGRRYLLILYSRYTGSKPLCFMTDSNAATVSRCRPI